MFSVIIPTYNRSHFLPRSINSVINQSFSQWELIIVDDASTDNTQDIILPYLKTYPNRIKCLKLPENKGVSYARNFAVKNSRFDWLAFLDSDDEWFEDKLMAQANFISTQPYIPIIHGNEIWIKDGEILAQKISHKKSGGRQFTRSVDLCCISPSTVCLKKSLFLKHGGFREDFPVCEDYDLWLKITADEEIGFIESPLITKYGGHFDQLSKKYFAMDYWRLRSLFQLRKNAQLSLDETEYLYKVGIKKAKILLKGYEKHQNFQNYQEVKDIETTLNLELKSL